MKVADRIKVIVGVLYESKTILSIYKKHGYPTEGDDYKLFVYDVGKAISEMEHHQLGRMVEWLYTNEGNNLPYSSSGSTRMALEDFDGFLGHIETEVDDDLTEEEHQFAGEVYNGMFK